MFVAPPEKEVEWSDSGLDGSFRWLARVWRMAQHWRDAAGGPARPLARAELTAAERALRRKTHDTIRRVTADIDVRKQFNTAISAMMELVNDLYRSPSRRTSRRRRRRRRGAAKRSRR